MKKPKPVGNGNYSLCEDCHGIGFLRRLIRSRNSKNPAEKEAFAGTICKKCKGAGWVDAQR